jgi:glucokinase
MSPGWVLGVDIGGTNIVVGVIPEEGGAPGALRARATARDPDEAVHHVARLTGEVVQSARDAGHDVGELRGVGIGCPGPLDLAAGIVLDAFNLGWRDYPIRDAIGGGMFPGMFSMRSSPMRVTLTPVP